MSHREVSERQARLEFLIESASRTFAIHGIGDSSLDLIAREAEYTRRTLYSYFKGRDEIVLSVFLRDLKTRIAVHEEAVQTARGGLNKLISWAESYLHHALDHPDSFRLQSYVDFNGINHDRIDADLLKSFNELNEQLRGQLRSIFEEGLRDRCFLPGLNVDICVSQFVHSMRAILSVTISEGGSIACADPQYYFFSFLGVFIRGIRRI